MVFSDPQSSRRHFLTATAALAISAGMPRIAGAAGGRVVIVGGGWGGLAAARELRRLAPQMDVVLIDRNSAFFSCPLSNRWLADLIEGRALQHDYERAATRHGYRFLRAGVSAIDRERREVLAGDERIAYDWLILAVGIRYDYRAWFGDDTRAAAETESRFGCAFRPGEQAALKQRLDAFTGGTLVMNVPLMPYRCPPAPYERACMIASLFKARNIKGRIILLDPNPTPQGFNRIFNGQYRDRIVHVPQAGIRSLDPFGKKLATDVEDFHFDEAILMPPQQAGDLAHQAGLTRDGWAEQEALTFRARADERIYLVGDMIGRASPLFGYYPKSGHMAAAQGRIAAAQIAARAAGGEAPQQLPESICYVLAGAEPMEMMRLETSYRIRGDGAIMQTAKQHYDPQPRDEDIAWAKSMFADMLAGEI